MAQDDENVVILEEAEFEQDEETAPLEEQDGGDSEYMVSLDELEPVAPEQPAEVQEVGKKSKKKLFVIGGAAGVLALILTVILFLVFKSDRRKTDRKRYRGALRIAKIRQFKDRRYDRQGKFALRKRQ